MPPSLFPSDQELPTWLHTLLLVILVLPFAGFLFWFGISAIATGQLEPISGPDFGQFFFGPGMLQGKAARLAGVSLLAFGGAFLAIAFRFSRLSNDSMRSRLLPWILVAAHLILSFWVKSIK